MDRNPSNQQLADAIRELRDASGESQQAFGSRLGVSIVAMSRYEQTHRSPCPRILAAFYAEAVRVGRHDDLAEQFQSALEGALQMPAGLRLYFYDINSHGQKAV